MMEHLRTLSATVLLMVSVSPFASGQSTFERNPIDAALDLVEVDARTYMLINGTEYGTLGSAGFSVPVVFLRPMAYNAMFGGDLTVHPILGMGTRYQQGNIGAPLPMRFVEVQLGIPLFNISKPAGIQPPITINLVPGIGFALIKNYATGNENGVGVRSLGFSTDVRISDAVKLTAEYRWSETDPRGFLWSSSYRAFGVGMSFSLGSCARQLRQYKREAEGVLLRTGQRMSMLQDSLVLARETAQKAVQNASLQNDARLAKELQNVRGELQELQRQIKQARPEPAQDAPTQQSLPIASLDHSLSAAIAYDDRRLPQTRLIRIEKKLFDQGDLVEEVYLKSILAILNNYDNFVWEIAFRDALTKDGFAGRDLANKIKHFFEMYNSRFNRKLTLVHDDSIRSEYEIRCLGIAR